MNGKVVGIQIIIFSVQWALMLFGFGLLALVIAPKDLIPFDLVYARIIDSVIKAGIALAMSIFWLYIWDRQVRRFVYRREQ